MTITENYIIALFGALSDLLSSGFFKPFIETIILFLIITMVFSLFRRK